ncbi:MAG: electron transporter RnfD [Proteobacteria bacterium]|nr:MAG: electron transporter RnfD [Pseudomonadota bacterium]
MKQATPELVLSTGPFLRTRSTTSKIMLEVLICALIVLAFAVWNFGIGALLSVVAATAGAVVTEWYFTRHQPVKTLKDNTAALTGVLLGLTLPPTMPLWMALLGGAVGIGLGKLIWGGLGQNSFNPALVGRAFLQAAFPTAITTWAPPVDNIFTVYKSQLALPLMSGQLDGLSAATPLGLMKFEATRTATETLFVGDVAGSLGETSALVLVLVGVWMAWRRIFDWRLAVSTLLGVAVLSGVIWLIDSSYPSPDFMLLSGGLMFAAVFMVTDPVSTPTTPGGAWIFGFGVAVFVVLIRIWGGLPEGVMYAVLLMNALTPHINHYTQPRVFGQAKARKEAAK